MAVTQAQKDAQAQFQNLSSTVKSNLAATPGSSYNTVTQQYTPGALNSSGSSQPQQQASSTPPLASAGAFNPPNYDQLIAPAIEGYNNYISTLQGQLPSTLDSINSDLTNKTNDLNQNIGAQTQTINTAKGEQQTSQDNAANEARRIYSEIQQGLQSRYGGTTGTGAFATEIAGAQTGRDISSIRTTGAQLLKQLDDKLQQVQEIGRLSLQDLQTQAEKQKTDAKNNLDLQIADIRSKIGETQARKADLYANAYNNYQGYVQSVNQQNTAFQQQLYAQQITAQQQLEAAKQHTSSIAATATPQDLQSLISQGFSVNGSVQLPNGAKANVSAQPRGAGQLKNVFDNGLQKSVIQYSDGTITNLDGSPYGGASSSQSNTSDNQSNTSNGFVN